MSLDRGLGVCRQKLASLLRRARRACMSCTQDVLWHLAAGGRWVMGTSARAWYTRANASGCVHLGLIRGLISVGSNVPFGRVFDDIAGGASAL